MVQDPGLIPTALEELIRYYSTVTVGRRVTQDIEFHGCPFTEGQIVFMPMTAASRDPAEFAEADGVRIDRAANRHMAFGAGPHRCLGSHLARRELRIGIEIWHRYIPGYEIVPGFDPFQIVEHSGGGVLGLSSLPLRWPAP
jgi:cytochrome P450